MQCFALTGITNKVHFSTECIHLLLAHGAPVKVKNLNGWSPLAEAISFGDRQTSKFADSKVRSCTFTFSFHAKLSVPPFSV